MPLDQFLLVTRGNLFGYPVTLLKRLMSTYGLIQFANLWKHYTGDHNYKVVSCCPIYYVLDLDGKQDKVSIDRLRPAHLPANLT